MKLRLLLPGLAVVWLMSSTLSAAIISIVNSAALQTGTAGSSHTLTSFDPGTGSSKLVVSLASEGQGGPRTINSITFGGVPLTAAIDATSTPNTDHRASIFYLDNPGSTPGNIVVSWGGGSANGIGLSALSLANTEPGFALVNTSGTSNSVSITTTVPDSFLVAVFVDNDPGTLMNVDAPLTPLFGGANIGSATGAAGYLQVPSPGLVTASATGGPGVREAASVAVFTPIPEPTTLTLTAFGLLLAARYRWRRKAAAVSSRG